MTQLKMLGAAALLASALADPGDGATDHRHRRALLECLSGCPMPDDGTRRHRQPPITHRTTRRDRDWQDSYNRYDPGPFAPVDAAAGVVGGAVGTAAAIATAPFGGTPNTPAARSAASEYARQNGFVCTPGTWFRGSRRPPAPLPVTPDAPR